MTVRDPSMTKNNIHPYLGVPEGEKVAYHYEAPVTDETRDFLETALREIYPDKEIDIIGSFFDYSKSDNMAYNGPQGYFRVQIDGVDHMLTSLIHDGQRTYEASAIVTNAIEYEGVSVVRAVPKGSSFTHEISIEEAEFNDGQITDKIYLALEEDHPFDCAPVMITGIQDAEFELGEITGKIYKAHDNLTGSEEDILERASVDGVFSHLDKTFELFESEDGKREIQRVIPDGYIDLMEKLIYQRDHAEYRLSCYNNIEKTIARTPDGIVLSGVHDSAGIGGTLPMMTESATFDAGLTLARVVFDQGLYKDVDGQPMRGADVKKSMSNGLDAFIDGYNKTSGLRLTREQAFEAARMAIMKLTLTGIGLQQQTNSPSMYEQFINKTMKPLFDKIDNAQLIIEGKVKFDNTPKPRQS